jgi:uncharacterized membrane protein YfcA
MGIAGALAVLLAGFLIGATSIGGVLVVPALSRFEGVALPAAIAASACGFGLAAFGMLCVTARRAREPVSLALHGGALAGAALGAGLVHLVSARQLLAGVIAIVLFAGLRGLWQSWRGGVASAAAPALPAPALGAIGVLIGAGSALTGTGGPVLLTPVLLLLCQPPARVLAMAQAVQLPVAIASTAVHWSSGALDWRLALWIGLLVFAGSLAGARAVQRVSVELLQRLVSLLLLAVGAWYAVLALQ